MITSYLHYRRSVKYYKQIFVSIEREGEEPSCPLPLTVGKIVGRSPAGTHSAYIDPRPEISRYIQTYRVQIGARHR